MPLHPLYHPGGDTPTHFKVTQTNFLSLSVPVKTKNPQGTTGMLYHHNTKEISRVCGYTCMVEEFSMDK